MENVASQCLVQNVFLRFQGPTVSFQENKMFLDSRYKNYRIGELSSVEALSFFFHA